MDLHFRRAFAALLIAAAAASALSACAESRTGPSLAETKASAQLLRNDALGGINKELISGYVEWKDESKACDGDEMTRSWYSSGLVPIVPTLMSETASIMGTLAEGYEAKGWTVNGEGESLTLTKDSSTSLITLTVVPITGQLRIESEGPCVTTDGPDSDEVKLLES